MDCTRSVQAHTSHTGKHSPHRLKAHNDMWQTLCPKDDGPLIHVWHHESAAWLEPLSSAFGCVHDVVRLAMAYVMDDVAWTLWIAACAQPSARECLQRSESALVVPEHFEQRCAVPCTLAYPVTMADVTALWWLLYDRALRDPLILVLDHRTGLTEPIVRFLPEVLQSDEIEMRRKNARGIVQPAVTFDRSARHAGVVLRTTIPEYTVHSRGRTRCVDTPQSVSPAVRGRLWTLDDFERVLFRFVWPLRAASS